MLDWCPLRNILVTVAQIARLLRSASFFWRAPPCGSPRSRIAVRPRRRATRLVTRACPASPAARFDMCICLLACTVARMRHRSAICSPRVLFFSCAVLFTCCCPRVLLRRLYSPAGQGHRSWALPAASGSSVCPSPDFWASSQVRRPFEPCCPPARTRPAAAPARFRAAFPGPPAAITTTSALAALRRPFPPFSPALRPLVHRFSAPSVCPVCRPREAAPAAVAAARAAGRVAGAAGSMAAAWAVAEAAVWPPGSPVAAARTRVSGGLAKQQPSSSRAAAAAALEAAAADGL